MVEERSHPWFLFLPPLPHMELTRQLRRSWPCSCTHPESGESSLPWPGLVAMCRAAHRALAPVPLPVNPASTLQPQDLHTTRKTSQPFPGDFSSHGR